MSSRHGAEGFSDCEPSGARLPERFGNYSVVEHLATGGMAEVYVARKAGLQGFEKVVVLKRVRPELLHDQSATSLFLDEARLLATLQHPSIVQVYEIDRIGDSYVIVMEYVHGVDLRRLINEMRAASRPISLDDSVYIVSQVCAALHHAHEQTDLYGRPLEIIHCDVSPCNVLLGHDGTVKVCDFGIAKMRDRSQTKSGTIKGKFAYLSPEQCRSEPLDRRSDVFAIGILLYELTTSRKPFEAASDFELLRRIVEDSPLPPTDYVADYPAALATIVMRALEKRPGDRYPTAQAMQADLEELAREHQLTASSIGVAQLMHSVFDGSARDDVESPSEDADTRIDLNPVIEARAARATPPALARRPRRRWIAAMLAACGAVALPYVTMTREAALENQQGLSRDAQSIASVIDATARSAQLDVSREAASPLLRAAIATDAETFRDLATNEHAFIVAPGEVLEVLQGGSGAMTSLLRLPSDAPALPRPSAAIQLSSNHTELRLIATAGIDGKGAVMSSVPVELTHENVSAPARSVRIIGVTPEVRLLDRGPEPGRVIALRAAIPTKIAGVSLALAATFDAVASTPAWVLPVQLLCGALAVALGLAAALRRLRHGYPGRRSSG